MTRTRFTFAIRVYYEGTDAAGVVYYGNYLRYMQRARTEWLESLGFPLAAFEREHRVAFAVQRAEIDFLRPARLNERLDVGVEARERAACRLVVAQQVSRDGVALVLRMPTQLARALDDATDVSRPAAATGS